jgi:hypothetical protein
MVCLGYMRNPRIGTQVLIIENQRVIFVKGLRSKGMSNLKKRIEKIKKNLMNYAEEEFKFR